MTLFDTGLPREIKLESLDDGPGLLPFKMGAMNLVTYYHSFIQFIDLTDIEEKINSVLIQLENT